MKTIIAKTLLSALLLFIGISCEVDYDVGKLALSEPECIIVNGILTPEKEIEIHLYKLQILDSRYTGAGLEGAKIILKEGQKVLYDDICNDSILKIAFFPIENMTYSVEVSYDNLNTVKATTQIPPAIKCNAFIRSFGGYHNNIFELNSFEIPQTDSISMFVTAYAVIEKDGIEEEAQYRDLYINNAFVDRTNSVGGMPVFHEEVGSIYQDYFIRVKNKNLPLLDNLIFAPSAPYTYDLHNSYDTLVVHVPGVIEYTYSDPFSYQTKIKVKVITASIEYDQYCKSYYEQVEGAITGGDIAAVFQPKGVFSNVENGLGIFAGINEINHYFDLPKNEN